MRSKSISIEFMRIVACVLVIMAHCQLAVNSGSILDKGRLFFSTVIADDVPLFFLIAGFFLFRKIQADSDILPTFKYRAKNFLFNIYIPTVIYILIHMVVIAITQSGWTWGAVSSLNWTMLTSFIFRMQPNNHLWYICTYASFIFFFPMLAFLCQDTPQKNKIRRTLLAVTTISFIIADIQYFLKQPFFDVQKIFWSHPFAFLILGYELSVILPKLKAGALKRFIAGIAIYIIGFSIKFGLQIYMFNQYGEINNRFRWLQCTPCLVTAVGLFIAIYSLEGFFQKHSIISRVIAFVGSTTFSIYLFHALVITKTRFIRDDIIKAFDYCASFSTTVAYYISYALIVFAISFVIALVFDTIRHRLIRVPR